MILKSKDFTRRDYKRIIAIGCSFTEYHWPTWADLIAAEMPDAEYYNLATSGTGNLSQFWWLQYLIESWDLTPNDLIIQCFSTLQREDKIYQNSWLNEGHINPGANAGFYTDEYVEKYFDARGCAMRDLAFISGSVHIHEAGVWDAIVLQSVPNTVDKYDSVGNNESEYDNTSYLSATFDKYWHNRISSDINLKDSIGGVWPCTELDNFYVTNDPHPSPQQYRDWLEQQGIVLTEKSQQMVDYYNNVEYSIMTDIVANNWQVGEDIVFEHRKRNLVCANGILKSIIV